MPISKGGVSIDSGEYCLRPIGPTKRKGYWLLDNASNGVLFLTREELAYKIFDGTIELRGPVDLPVKAPR